MTVVLGRQSFPDEGAEVVPARPGIRRDLSWDERRTRYRQAHTPAVYPTWRLESEPSGIEAAPETPIESLPELVRPGLMWLYAARMAHARCDSSSIRRTSACGRLLVGEIGDDAGAVRAMALVGVTGRIGRGERAHYQRLHPALGMRYGRLRCGGDMSGVRALAAGFSLLPGAGRSHPAYARIGASKRMMVATICALLLIASAASTSFAGQAIVTPGPGQSPPDAARIAAPNEGASPWVASTWRWE